MSDRQSLGDFQARLIEGFGSEAAAGSSFIKVRLDQDYWLIDLMEIKEASVPSNIARNAAAPPWVVGIANFKGEVWTLIDMLFLIKNTRTSRAELGWVTLLNPSSKHLLALLWSDIVEVASKQEYHVSPNPPPERWCLRHWVDRSGRTWKELDVSQMVGPSGLVERWKNRDGESGPDTEVVL